LHKPISQQDWSANFKAFHPAFEQIPAKAHQLDSSRWPVCEYLNSLLPSGICNAEGMPIRFMAQDESLPWPELYYEQRIARHGLIATRDNWHDFFNAMIWCLFPNTKVVISALHATDFDPTASRRTRARDALTLFDENGALIVSSNHMLLQAIVNFDWRFVFVDQREAWHRHTACHIVGHALFEKLLTPYIGVTANTRLVHVPKEFFLLPKSAQRLLLDRCLADALINRTFQTPRNLSPLPLLGVPGWWSNQNQEFYANTDYFRLPSHEREATILTLSL